MCQLCAEISGDPSNDLLARLLGGPYRRWVLADIGRLAILPSVGPLVPGHLLICPRDHVIRFASLDAAGNGNLYEAKELVREALGRAYGVPVQFFEHGSSARGERVPCTVEHAHLHAVPLPDIAHALPTGSTWSSISPTLADLRAFVGDSEYLYYEGSTGGTFAARDLGSGFPSQLLRRAFAEQVELADEWNWREHPRVSQVRKTIVDLSPFLLPSLRNAVV
jgi:diadenosine tetraphosphate (Ap4A) HIT family hydrolase